MLLQQSAKTFEHDFKEISLYFNAVLFGVVALLVCINLFLASRSRRCKNCLLVMLLLCMLFNALCVCATSIAQLLDKTLVYANGLHKAADSSCILICSTTIVLVAANTRLIVDPAVYFDNGEKLDRAMKFRRKLFFASFLAAIIVFAIEVGQAMARDAIKKVEEWTMLVLRAVFLVTWICSFIRLYRTVNEVIKMRPKQKLFRLHGALLVIYLIFGGTAVFSKQMNSVTWQGIGILLTDVGSVVEQILFFLVVDLMLPLLEA